MPSRKETNHTMILQFTSLTHAGKAMTHLRRQGIECIIEKAAAGGCVYRLRIPEGDEKALALLRAAQIAFTRL